MKCLEKEKDARWQSAEDMLPALEMLGTPSGGITPTHTRPLPGIAARKPRPKVSLAALGVALLVLIAAGGWLFTRVPGGGGGGKIQQLAVLPIQDLSGKDQVFVDAMHDALISAIARKQVVGVVSRSAVMRFKDGSGTTEEIARQLRADAVIEATVFRDGERMRINVQMVEPVSLRYLWAQTYEREVKDVLGAQREIVDTIAAEVATTLSERTTAFGPLFVEPRGEALAALLPRESRP
jgi:TolB-like protein